MTAEYLPSLQAANLSNKLLHSGFYRGDCLICHDINIQVKSSFDTDSVLWGISNSAVSLEYRQAGDF